MKAVSAKDLIVGRVYSDVPLDREDATFFRYKYTEGKELIFEHIGGPIKPYKALMDNDFNFQSYGFPDIELTESEIEQYLPSLSTDRDGLAITSEDQ